VTQLSDPAAVLGTEEVDRSGEVGRMAEGALEAVGGVPVGDLVVIEESLEGLPAPPFLGLLR
jgi:hypothetical protein